MTKEEAIRIATGLRTDFKCESDTMVEFCNIVIKALEQESILDKIRAEIEQLRLHKAEFLTNDNKVCIDSQEVLNVIDKYKAESEE